MDEYKILSKVRTSLYRDILDWLKSLSPDKRWNLIIELIIDIKFIEYEESKPCTET